MNFLCNVDTDFFNNILVFKNKSCLNFPLAVVGEFKVLGELFQGQATVMPICAQAYYCLPRRSTKHQTE